MGIPIRVLIVEDHEEDYELLVIELKSQGYDVTSTRVETAHDMEAALNAQSWDLVISDFRLPSFSGPAALALLREKGLDTPFLVVSGMIGEETAVETMRTGVDDYLLKGRLARLGPAVRRAIERAADRRQRHRAEQNLAFLLRSVPTILYTASSAPELSTLWVSENVEHLTGFPASRFIEDGGFWKSRIHPDDAERTRQQTMDLTRLGMVTMEYRWCCADGTYRWFLDRMVVMPGRPGSPTEVAGTRVDISDKVSAEEKIKASLRDKESLLQEIHHRVKNNLQIITSLIYLQESKIKDPDARERLRECGDRVKVMAAIHEKLYQSPDLARIDFGGYLKDLARSTFRASAPSDERIKLKTDIMPVHLGLDRAVPCGLIVFELMSNALKHAFPGARMGEVSLRLWRENGRILISVSDTGAGMPQGLDPQATRTLGLRLVAGLAGQIDADIRWRAEGGTRVELSLPENADPIPTDKNPAPNPEEKS